MKISRIMLLAIAVFSMAVFAQDEETVSLEAEDLSPVLSDDVSESAHAVKSESAAVSAHTDVSPSLPAETENEKSGPKLRFSGDFYLNPAWERENEWEGERSDGELDNTFNVLYNWNTSFGVDFGDKFSLDFRLSNASGYACDYLSFEDGTAASWIPVLPNAYFTWRANDVFSLSGGLLEVSDNTVLNLVSGYERSGGLYTSFANWATEYNNSQGGIRFGFDFSESFSLGLTAALVNSRRVKDSLDDYEYYTWTFIDDSEFRFILDANIALGEKVTLSPVFQARSYYHNYTVADKEKSSILLAYGTDLSIELSDAVNLGFGVALGNIKGKNLSDSYWSGEKMSSFGLLLGVSPEFAFGFNEIAVGYSLGLASDKNKEGEKNMNTYHDSYCTWLFRVNDYFALGPSAYVLVQGSKNDATGDKSGYIWSRVGADLVVSF